ncbi:TMEM131, partial [Cordylochernes scorpioides]
MFSGALATACSPTTLGKTSVVLSTLVQAIARVCAQLILKPNHYAVFRVSITSPSREGLYAGEAFVETQYEGKISSANLYIQSTFSQPLSITSIRPVPEDPQYYTDSLHNVPLLQPEDRTYVGKVYFDPRKGCRNKCYSGLPTTTSSKCCWWMRLTSMGHQWLLGMSLPPDIGDIDAQHFSTLYTRWERTQRSMNLTLQLDTSEIRGFMLRARASLHWPRLTSKCSLRFPLTQIGTTS